ncbi:hypothetical protein LINPERHAP1_LOCUS20471 [Linum perenne]
MVESGGGGRLDSKVVVLRSKSYAEVVAPRWFSRAGGCELVKGKTCVIKVGKLGVVDRVVFFRRGLVFRLDALDGEYPDWKRFRKWVARFWGVPETVEIRAIGDDLWWLCSGSEEEVERVIALNSWKLSGHRVRADRWLVSSGS